MSSVITMANADAGAFSGGGGGGGTGMNYVAGEAIDITKKSNTGTISVKYDGSSIILNENGELMANIPEPEPTELYNAGDGIDINDRVISVKHDETITVNESGSVKHDETITVNESGQLHVVNSGGGSDSLWEKSTYKPSVEYEWIPQTEEELTDIQKWIVEFINLPLDYIRNDGQPFCSATCTLPNVTWTFYKQDDSFYSPLMEEIGQLPDYKYQVKEYVNTGNKVGVLFYSNTEAHEFIQEWQSRTTYTSMFGFDIIEPIEQLPIKATRIIAPGIPEHEDGVVNPFVSFNNLTEIQKSFGDISTNYMYINNCDATMSPQNILNIVLPNTIHDAEYNPLGNVISSLSNGKWTIL